MPDYTIQRDIADNYIQRGTSANVFYDSLKGSDLGIRRATALKIYQEQIEKFFVSGGTPLEKEKLPFRHSPKLTVKYYIIHYTPEFNYNKNLPQSEYPTKHKYSILSTVHFLDGSTRTVYVSSSRKISRKTSENRVRKYINKYYDTGTISFITMFLRIGRNYT